MEQATAAFEDYNYARALELAESFFWSFCDDYIELVKERAHGTHGPEQAASAGAALARAVRATAAVRPDPAVRHRGGLVVVATRQRAHRRLAVGEELPAGGDPRVLAVSGQVLSAMRKVKSDNKVSMRARLAHALVKAPVADAAAVESARKDLEAAGGLDTAMRIEPSDDFEVIAELTV